MIQKYRTFNTLFKQKIKAERQMQLNTPQHSPFSVTNLQHSYAQYTSIYASIYNLNITL